MKNANLSPLRFVPTRAAGLSMLEDFVPAMGRRYANGRNYDHGAGKHKSVSQLSPYIRRRLITETEVLAAALNAHGAEEAEKFIDEVIWRGYFKGWLERRPQVWNSYVQGVNSDLAAVNLDRRLRRDLARATDGQTGIACFDAWAQELVETGYLHNHARMWFASIWIFTLGLPWRLGADFFFRHLLDGDAASNTLGWRWAAGLHTRGKPYPARADNIATFTSGRFAPRASDLAEVTEGLEDTEPNGLPSVQELRSITAPALGLPTALLITDEDGCLQDFNLPTYDICAVATLAASHLRSPLAVADHVTAFEAGSLDDTARRVGLNVEAMTAGDPSALAVWAAKAGAKQIVTAFITQGPLQDFMAEAAPALAARGIALCEWRRDYDAAIWPFATAGFFKVRQKIPDILAKTVPDWMQE
jgi:deoxyribodipyrimidine photo-lyase